jgi:hypothetical protein
VITIDEDDSLERELFALRATALPEPALDLGGVLARVRARESERAARARLVAWIGAASCAAASLVLAVSDVHRVDAQADTFVTNDDATLMCARVPASRLPTEVLESHDDTNVCRAP